MKIMLLSEESIRLEPMSGQLTIEAESADQAYSPYHMLASSLATCTFGVMQSWAANIGVTADDLVIEVSWKFADNPHRVGTMEMTFDWPSLPADRVRVAERVAALCPVHKTLSQSTEVAIRSAAAPAALPAPAGASS